MPDVSDNLPARGEPGAAGSLPRGTTIHRYVLLDEVGAGGMGVVYAAYDHGLDRKVALKFVRDPARATGHRRIMREAHALAQLSHPNVVAVFDVGTYRDQVFVAMEFVAGQTLRSWLTGAKRSWREVLDVYRRAGEGLAAAHAAGIVHRDFKPDNVLIDRQGRVRVGDFGLALIERDEDRADAPPVLTSSAAALGSGAPAGDDPTHDPAHSDLGAAFGSLTATGAAVGTPAYMAPEQHSGRVAGARADQFGFCVSLHEALCGERPFGDEGAPDLDERIAAGAIRPPPRDRTVPAWLRRILRRGLAYQEDRRYPSMEALLADIDRELRMRRRLVVAAGLAAAAVGVGALVMVAAPWQATEETRCRSAAQHLTGVWDAPRREAVRRAFRAVDPSVAGRVLPPIEGALDRYAQSWVAMHTESCEATHIRGDQPAAVLDLRTQCLEQRLSGMVALTDLFRTADKATLSGAMQAVSTLEPLDLCADAAALAEVTPPPNAAARATAEKLRERLEVVRALASTGKVRLALEKAGPLAAEARALGYRPLEAEALAALGRAQRMNDKQVDAEETLYQAIAAGEAGHHARATAQAWIDLLWVVGNEQMRFEEAGRLGQVARGAIQRLGGNLLSEAQLEEQLGVMYMRQGKHKEARETVERAVGMFRKLYGPDHFQMARPLRHLGDVHQLIGTNEDAVRLYRQSRAMVEKVYGPDHPRVTSLLGAEGASLYYLGRLDEALAIFERGLAAEERIVGPNTHTAGTYLRFIGLARWHTKDYKGAEQAFKRGVTVMEKLFGRDHIAVAAQLSNLGEFLTERKRRAEAAVHLERAAAIQERALGPDHPDLALALDRLAQVHIEGGKPKLAIPLCERSLRIREARPGVPRQIAITRVQLAQALHRARRQRGRVKLLLRQALRGLEQGGGGLEEAGDAEMAAFVRKWLAAPGLKEPAS
jgi:tetratricopeptide (TPR) repeat protein/predicted Ser/Thr protein kinase